MGEIGHSIRLLSEDEVKSYDGNTSRLCADNSLDYDKISVFDIHISKLGVPMVNKCLPICDYGRANELKVSIIEDYGSLKIGELKMVGLDIESTIVCQIIPTCMVSVVSGTAQKLEYENSIA